jgi:hypothetical protein
MSTKRIKKAFIVDGDKEYEIYRSTKNEIMQLGISSISIQTIDESFEVFSTKSKALKVAKERQFAFYKTPKKDCEKYEDDEKLVNAVIDKSFFEGKGHSTVIYDKEYYKAFDESFILWAIDIPKDLIWLNEYAKKELLYCLKSDIQLFNYKQVFDQIEVLKSYNFNLQDIQKHGKEYYKISMFDHVIWIDSKHYNEIKNSTNDAICRMTTAKEM